MMTSPSVGQQAGLDSDVTNVDLRRVRYFVAVAEELHFTRAARRMGITQSSLSAAIQRLEAEHGTPLLRRSTRRVALTPEGRRVLREARGLLRAVDRFAAPPERTAATLRIGACPPARVPLLDAIVEECVQLGFTGMIALREELTGALLSALDEGELDAVVTLGTDPAGNGRRVELLATVPLQVALSSADPRSRRPSIELHELSGMTLYVLGDEAAAGSREIALEACREAGFEPDVHASRFAYSRPPLRGEMFALLPALPGQPWTADVALVPLAEPAPTISFHLVWRDDHDPAVDAFITAARRVRAARS